MPFKDRPNRSQQVAYEFKMLDSMILSLVEVLDEKSQIKYSDWEARLKKSIHEKSKIQ